MKMNDIKWVFFVITMACFYFACEEPEKIDKKSVTELLTTPIWLSDSLLADGIEAGGIDGMLHKFAGETKFNKDGTGQVGEYTGTWYLNENETELIINADSLPAEVTTYIDELTEASLKINTVFPHQDNPSVLIGIRMTFKAKP